MFDRDEATLRMHGDESGGSDVGRRGGGGRGGRGGRGRGRHGRGGRGGRGGGGWGVYDGYLDPYASPVFLLPTEEEQEIRRRHL